MSEADGVKEGLHYASCDAYYLFGARDDATDSIENPDEGMYYETAPYFIAGPSVGSGTDGSCKIVVAQNLSTDGEPPKILGRHMYEENIWKVPYIDRRVFRGLYFSSPSSSDNADDINCVTYSTCSKTSSVVLPPGSEGVLGVSYSAPSKEAYGWNLGRKQIHREVDIDDFFYEEDEYKDVEKIVASCVYEEALDELSSGTVDFVSETGIPDGGWLMRQDGVNYKYDENNIYKHGCSVTPNNGVGGTTSYTRVFFDGVGAKTVPTYVRQVRKPDNGVYRNEDERRAENKEGVEYEYDSGVYADVAFDVYHNGNSDSKGSPYAMVLAFPTVKSGSKIHTYVEVEMAGGMCGVLTGDGGVVLEERQVDDSGKETSCSSLTVTGGFCTGASAVVKMANIAAYEMIKNGNPEFCNNNKSTDSWSLRRNDDIISYNDNYEHYLTIGNKNSSCSFDVPITIQVPASRVVALVVDAEDLLGKVMDVAKGATDPPPGVYKEVYKHVTHDWEYNGRPQYGWCNTEVSEDYGVGNISVTQRIRVVPGRETKIEI